jgi:hypothetical protein
MKNNQISPCTCNSCFKQILKKKKKRILVFFLVNNHSSPKKKKKNTCFSGDKNKIHINL